MSQSLPTPTLARSTADADGVRTLDDETTVEAVLTALDDADCRAILDATGERALSANEVSEECDLALSTAYRKLDALTDAGLLAERTRIRRSGKHASEYLRAVEGVTVDVSDGDGPCVRVVPRDVPDRPSTPTGSAEAAAGAESAEPTE